MFSPLSMQLRRNFTFAVGRVFATETLNLALIGRKLKLFQKQDQTRFSDMIVPDSEKRMRTLKDLLTLTEADVPTRCVNKVTIVGAGQVGMATAFSLLTQNVTGNVTLIDTMAKRVSGEVLDLDRGSVFLSSGVEIHGSTHYEDSQESAVCVLCVSSLPVAPPASGAGGDPDVLAGDPPGGPGSKGGKSHGGGKPASGVGGKTRGGSEKGIGDRKGPVVNDNANAGRRVVGGGSVVDSGASSGVDSGGGVGGIANVTGSTSNEIQRAAEVITSVVPRLLKFSPNCVLIVVSQPVDVMTYVAWRVSRLPANRVLGLGTALDSANFRALLARRLGFAPANVDGWIIGEQGPRSIPVWSGVNAAGVRIVDLIPELESHNNMTKWNQLHLEAVQTGQDVVRLKGHSSWALGLSAAALVRAVLSSSKDVFPVSTLVQGHYGVEKEVFLSLPCVIYKKGIRNIVNQDLTEKEKKKFQESSQLVYATQQSLHL